MLDLAGIRRALHRIPELAFEETKTSDVVFETVSGLVQGKDAEVTRFRTGIIVHIPGEHSPGKHSPGNHSPGTTIGWRADMDGLPIAEATGLPFASEHDGVMHACGHDIHMTCGLGILERVLRQPRRNSFVFLFQPAEEHLSGAQAVVDQGLLDKYEISEFYALHVSPEFAPGVIATRPGTLFAGSASVEIEFAGVPGHAGMPHRAVDPIVAVASFVMGVQALVSRNVDPAAGGVALTFGTISGGTVVNGVAASAKVAGTLRFLDERQHALSFRRIREIAAGTAMATGTAVDARLTDSPWVPVVNDPEITARFIDYMQKNDKVSFADAPVTMTSEDFGYLINRIPGMMFWLGTGGEHPLHSDRFAPDDAVIEPAVSLLSGYLTRL